MQQCIIWVQRLEATDNIFGPGMLLCIMLTIYTQQRYKHSSLCRCVKYELLEHTADIFIKAYGKTVEEIFENSAFALFDQIADLSRVSPVGEERVELRGENRELLLVDYLNELLYMHDAFNELYCEFDVSLNDDMLSSSVRGEKIDRGKHVLKTNVKAVTYHMLELMCEMCQ
jgi:SHS2 domain-containing protein